MLGKMIKYHNKALNTVLLILSIVSISAKSLAAEVTEIDRIKKRGKLIVGMCTINQKPFYFNDEDGHLVGIDLNIANEIAKELDVKLEIIQDRGDWNAVVDDVASGRTDLALSYISFTPARAQLVKFSQPYATVSMVFSMNRSFLAKAQAEGLMTLKDMFKDPKYPLYTYAGSSYYEMASSLFPKTKLHTDPSTTRKLLANEGAAYFSDDLDVSTSFIANPEYKLQLINYQLKGFNDVIAIPVHYNNPRLLSLVNSVLRTRAVDYKINDLIKLLQKPFDEHEEEENANEHN